MGITGVPGVGKSTFIETLGTKLTDEGRRVAVLAVDPTSVRTGGSILGDKTRMPRLATNERAFIRASPTSGSLGGVTRTTRQAIIVLEAAGHDVVLVETVGVGQSETVVHGMVDFFLVLMLAGAGDDLQVIKKGVLELADMLAVNKADGAKQQPAELAAAEIRRAVQLLEPSNPNWQPPVVTVSGQHGHGVDQLWQLIEDHRRTLTDTGDLAELRSRQRLGWMDVLLEQRLLERFASDDEFTQKRSELEAAVLRGEMTAAGAVDKLMAGFD